MASISVRFLSGKNVGKVQTIEVESNLVGWFFEVGGTYTRPGVGRFEVVSV